MTIGMATPTVEELEAENERLRKRIKFIYESSKNDIYAENERLRSDNAELIEESAEMDRCNAGLQDEIERLRAALERISAFCDIEDGYEIVGNIAREALKDG